MYRGTSLCDDDFLVAMVVVVVGGSVSGTTTVVSVVVGATVVVVLGTVVVTAPVVVVVAGGAFVTVKGVVASSVSLKAWTVALPAVDDGGTVSGPPVNVADPLESAVPTRVAFPDSTKSMTMQLGLSAAQAWKLFRVIENELPGAPELGLTVMEAA